jgi:uncharacterized membrane protein
LPVGDGSSIVALTGFVITVKVLVAQMATGTFYARYMRLQYAAACSKSLLALLGATLTFALTLLRATPRSHGRHSP